jgi:Xaa-Pro aminopeptidase
VGGHQDRVVDVRVIDVMDQPTEAGYRHSDSVAVTEDGTERLTYSPRGLDGNIV